MRIKGTVLACLVLFSTFPSPLPADPATVLTLGAVLGNLMNEVEAALNAARNAGDSVEMDAARQAELTIENVQNAYQSSLNVTFNEKIDPTIQGTIDQVTSMVNDVTSRVFTSADQAAARGQQIANTLPFRQSEPQVTSVSPHFIPVANSVSKVRVIVQGNFPCNGQASLAASLRIGAHSYQPSSNTTQELDFVVPFGDLFAQPPKVVRDREAEFKHGVVDTIASEYSLHRFTTIGGDLSVPWKKSCSPGIFETAQTDHFKIQLALLPQMMGVMTFTNASGQITLNTSKTFSSPSYHQCSTAPCGNNDDTGHPYSVTPDSGCTVIQNTSQILANAVGSWSDSFVSDDSNAVKWKVTTIHHGIFGTSGDVSFRITFQETCPSGTPSTSSDSDYYSALPWNSSFSMPFKITSDSPVAGTVRSWKIALDAFDQSHSEFVGAGASKFLRVSETLPDANNQIMITLTTPDPSTIDF
jgi:hypothetical protein